MISLQLGRKQLDSVFQYLVNRYRKYFYSGHTQFIMKLKKSSLGTIAVKLDERQFDDTFNLLTNGFQNRKYIYKYLLEITAMKLNEKQLKELNDKQLYLFTKQLLGRVKRTDND
ncbi:hypothetical protein RFI_00509 [Reticulomyxa filosa]|uniref:Uncharacterized protein n=1 Tax=Reticulomyxa filosa TaxID=46433 RepID=X6PEM0_RETFI|nr:hypothetical protein RFI_00509 [Reticulomyxa filosa]|eukprot:ETO36553.1 hypothetical protein RFI_00509 [Reticulomyxa filosa]